VYKVSSLSHTAWACAVYMCNVCAVVDWWAVPQTPVAKKARLPCKSQYTSCRCGFAGARAIARSIRPSIVGATSAEVHPTPLLSLAIDTSGSDFPTCVLAGCGRPKQRSAHFCTKFSRVHAVCARNSTLQTRLVECLRFCSTCM